MLPEEVNLDGEGPYTVQIFVFLRIGNWDAKIVLFCIKQDCNGRFLFLKENNFGNVKDKSRKQH